MFDICLQEEIFTLKNLIIVKKKHILFTDIKIHTVLDL